MVYSCPCLPNIAGAGWPKYLSIFSMQLEKRHWDNDYDLIKWGTSNFFFLGKVSLGVTVNRGVSYSIAV